MSNKPKRRYSHDERLRVLERLKGGESPTEVASKIGISYSTLRRWWKQHEMMNNSIDMESEKENNAPPEMKVIFKRANGGDYNVMYTEIDQEIQQRLKKARRDEEIAISILSSKLSSEYIPISSDMLTPLSAMWTPVSTILTPVPRMMTPVQGQTRVKSWDQQMFETPLNTWTSLESSPQTSPSPLMSPQMPAKPLVQRNILPKRGPLKKKRGKKTSFTSAYKRKQRKMILLAQKMNEAKDCPKIEDNTSPLTAPPLRTPLRGIQSIEAAFCQSVMMSRAKDMCNTNNTLNDVVGDDRVMNNLNLISNFPNTRKEAIIFFELFIRWLEGSDENLLFPKDEIERLKHMLTRLITS